MENKMIKYLTFIYENSFYPEYNVNIKDVDKYVMDTKFEDISYNFNDWINVVDKYNPTSTHTYKLNQELFNEVKKSFTKKFDDIAEDIFISGFEFESYDIETLINMIKLNADYFMENIDYNNMDEEELIKTLTPIKEKIAKEYFITNYIYSEEEIKKYSSQNVNVYLGCPGYNFFTEYYGDEYIANTLLNTLKKNNNIKLSDLINFNKLKKIQFNKLSYQEKYEWYIDDICDYDDIRNQVINYDKSNILILFKNCDDLCIKDYEFQKKYILKFKKQGKNIAKILKIIHDKCGLDDKISKEYEKFTYLISVAEFNI